jgi:hypothetical protein
MSNPFLISLAPGEEIFGYFMQDSMTPRAANESIRAWCGVLRINGVDKIISKGLLTSQIPRFKLKSIVYANNPHDLGALKQNICEALDNIQQCELQVSRNLYKIIQTCLAAEGTHFEHLL